VKRLKLKVKSKKFTRRNEVQAGLRVCTSRQALSKKRQFYGQNSEVGQFVICKSKFAILNSPYFYLCVL
jgi:hypothetical protein